MIISISLSDWVVNSYLSGTNNRSRRAEKLIILGAEAEIKTTDQDKNLIMRLIQDNDNLKAEKKQLQLKIATLQSKVKRTVTEPVKKELYDDRTCNLCKQEFDYELISINNKQYCKDCVRGIKK